ncbi:hypothetical protein C7Y66_23335 [Chroococcidiopsis sp. CCALA 051]|uniref:hypothetical protein n=1 Tax=Chroococcidiopsis sp. CCALA 051 TaxID=869949 RepID=UPI000D0CFA29|nr:hypothetical protein [Chroococcidiopsis sp. CCALA 051]PSM46767.1 hypothetical protein C7Y66_23335 [Chroococcidiopsis sp. CCALA 051]
MKVILAILLLSLAIAFPAAASVCRTRDGHQICILSIQRSAKNYWEYRAAVSIDGVKGDTEVYNCRDRVKVQKDRVVPFRSDDPGEVVCSFFKRSS